MCGGNKSTSGLEALGKCTRCQEAVISADIISVTVNERVLTAQPVKETSVLRIS